MTKAQSHPAQTTCPDGRGRDDALLRRITVANMLISGLAFAGLATAYAMTNSQSALAQSVDSLSDWLTAIGLLYVIALARQPADHNHVAGHSPAEPIAALVLAVLTGVMGTEVIRRAIEALYAHQQPELPGALVIAYTLKVIAKLAIVAACRSTRQRSPALRALEVDGRNDVFTGLLAITSFGLARSGWSQWDAWLAIPVGLWVITSGFLLAKENIGLLMGESAPEERHASLRRLVEATPEVISCHGIQARHHGSDLVVIAHIVVDPTISLKIAHDIGERVRTKLVRESDVVVAHVHLDVEDDSITGEFDA